MQAMSQWRKLGMREPTALVQSRATLHHAAQLLALAGASYLEARPDDSHTSMSWLDSFRALATQPIAAKATFRFALRLRELALTVIDDESDGEGAAFPLHGRTRAEGLEWMRAEASRLGLDGARLRSQLHFAIASHPTDDGQPFERATDGTLEELATWYGNASLVLETKVRLTDGAGPVRSWPHHFDIATLVRPPRTGALETIGIGLSPGDESYAEPYYYVGPYPAPTVRPRPLSVGTWHTAGWWGGVLTGSEIVKQPTTEGEAALVTGFIDEAVERLLDVNNQRA